MFVYAIQITKHNTRATFTIRNSYSRHVANGHYQAYTSLCVKPLWYPIPYIDGFTPRSKTQQLRHETDFKQGLNRE